MKQNQRSNAFLRKVRLNQTEEHRKEYIMIGAEITKISQSWRNICSILYRARIFTVELYELSNSNSICSSNRSIGKHHLNALHSINGAITKQFI